MLNRSTLQESHSSLQFHRQPAPILPVQAGSFEGLRVDLHLLQGRSFRFRICASLKDNHQLSSTSTPWNSRGDLHTMTSILSTILRFQKNFKEGPTPNFAELEKHIYMVKHLVASSKIGGKVTLASMAERANCCQTTVKPHAREIAHAISTSSVNSRGKIAEDIMGNSKNKRNSYSKHHRHAYRKKKMPWEKIKIRKNKQKQTVSQTMSLEGNRIVNLDQLQQYTDELSKHAMQCQGSVTLSCEARYGLASILSGQCSTCNHTIKFQTPGKWTVPTATDDGNATWQQCGGRCRLEGDTVG